MQTHLRWTHGLLAAGVLLTLLAPLCAAQVGTFGNQVKVGDFDYIPLTKSGAVTVTDPAVTITGRVFELDMGQLGVVDDNCMILDVKGNGLTPALSNTGPIVDDLRLNPCLGKDAGTKISSVDATETTVAAVARTVFVSCVDVNGNAKYDKGDLVYLTTAATGLAASTAPGTWTLRLTGGTNYPVATLVKLGDTDFSSWGNLASPKLKGCGAGTPGATGTWAAVEREDKGWYLVPVTAASVPANTLIPVNSIRLGLTGTTNLQPDVKPLTITVGNPDILRADDDFQVTVQITNGGTQAGQGILVTKLDGQLVDAKLTPLLSPGENGVALLKVHAPSWVSGATKLTVNDLFQVVSFQGGSSTAPSGGDLSALQSQINDLKAQVAALKSAASTTSSAAATGSAIKTQGSPSMAPVAMVGGLLAVALVARRRAE